MLIERSYFTRPLQERNMITRPLQFAVFRSLMALLVGLCASLSVNAQEDIAARVYRKASNSVVTIEVTDKTGKKSQGSGVVVKMEKGSGSIIVTNAHVVFQANAIRVSHRKKLFPATIWYAFDDVSLDIAFLQVDEQIEAAQSRTNDIEIGAAVFAIGSPLGLQTSISSGIVAGKRSGKAKIPLIQTTAAISPGSSGGGLFDVNSELIAITSFKVARGDNLNFAIDARLIPSLMIGIASAKLFQKTLLATQLVEVHPLTAQTFQSSFFVYWMTKKIIESKYQLQEAIQLAAAIDGKSSNPGFDHLRPEIKKMYADLLREWEASEEFALEMQLRGLKTTGGGADELLVKSRPKASVPITLQCNVTSAYDGTSSERILKVDFERQEVNGYAAAINENAIRFTIMGKDMEYLHTLSRVSGRLVIGTAQFPQLLVGPCETVSSRKF